MSSGMGAQEVDRGALNKEASTCSEVEGRRKDNETTRSSLPKDKPQDNEASRSSYSDKPSETEGSTSTPKQAKKHKGGKKMRDSQPSTIRFRLSFPIIFMIIGSWNVRGLNNTRKQQSQHAGTVLIARILVGWNTLKFQVRCIHSSAQWLTCDINNLSGLHITRITFVYGCNDHVARSSLWHYLQTESLSNASTPWGIMGDFNSVLCPSDRSGGSSHWQSHHQDFPNCIMQSSLQQIPYTGLHLTWHNNQTGEGTIMKKLDWMFGNQAFFCQMAYNRELRFLPREASGPRVPWL
ncbi:hypothetical protein OIU85_023090 [Salix viminalis]|uniref:Endonuclease/exonuclease/phosphatase domain-containing protein n=1 Tax=Salix viminalis TaxID=40686 RepID=A0A9Q0U886_SALVM|nr:hypothetical protein OIU85_023090 [Salix viminalis]